jgi:NADPH2:quinone reductase
VQLASAMGHTVVALSRSPEKRDQLLGLGAVIVLDPQSDHWLYELKTQLRGRRVDLAIDNIGGELFKKVIDSLGDHGKISVVGMLAGPVPQFNTASLLFRRLRVGGVAVGAYTNAESRSAWKQILDVLGKRNARPLVDHVFSFDQVIPAFERLREGPMGKVLVRVA